MRKLVWVLILCGQSFAAISHVTGACSKTGTNANSSNSETFSCTANAANDAILFKVTCGDSGTVTSVSLSATGWTITTLTNATGSAGTWVASFGALAPNTSATTFTATFTGASNCSNYEDYAMDEFSGNDTTGGTTTFDAHNAATGSGSCSVSVTAANANDAIWGACEDSTTAIGSGYTKGQDDAGGDWTEYKIGFTGAQTVNFTGSGTYAVVAATIKPSGGGGGSSCTSKVTLKGVGCI